MVLKKSLHWHSGLCQKPDGTVKGTAKMGWDWSRYFQLETRLASTFKPIHVATIKITTFWVANNLLDIKIHFLTYRQYRSMSCILICSIGTMITRESGFSLLDMINALEQIKRIRCLICSQHKSALSAETPNSLPFHFVSKTILDLYIQSLRRNRHLKSNLLYK